MRCPWDWHAFHPTPLPLLPQNPVQRALPPVLPPCCCCHLSFRRHQGRIMPAMPRTASKLLLPTPPGQSAKVCQTRCDRIRALSCTMPRVSPEHAEGDVSPAFPPVPPNHQPSQAQRPLLKLCPEFISSPLDVHHGTYTAALKMINNLLNLAAWKQNPTTHLNVPNTVVSKSCNLAANEAPEDKIGKSARN